MRTQSLGPAPQDQPALRLLIMGPPGAGKGTQSQAVADQRTMASGGYIDDEITNAVVASRLTEEDAHGFLFDGYPRTLPRVTALDRLLVEQAADLTAVVVLVADPQDVTAGLLARAYQQGRDDDTPEVIGERLQVYQRETAPVLPTYRQRRHLLEVDAPGQPDDVTQPIVTALETARSVQP